MLVLTKYSFGVGDRFAHQAEAQLRACMLAQEAGAYVAPVWNKSHREHTTIGSEPSSTRRAADAAVAKLDWSNEFHLDADHINLGNVAGFLDHCDFFTIDVADAIGQAPDAADVDAFIERHPELLKEVTVEGIDAPLSLDRVAVAATARKFLAATQKAGQIYRHIAQAKNDPFIIEVSMDETDTPQTPPELLVILVALADEDIPLQTIAPKFTGRFNKGVDYVGDVEQFAREFNDDLAVLAHAVTRYGLPESLKLSVHSGSDKFSIYAPIREAIRKFDAGLHIKTAGTTWLEELIGLAEADGDGLAIAKEIYAEALANKDALCEPYASVIDIDESALPTADEVAGWSATDYVSALRHDQSNPAYNPSFRQLLHVGYKIAAQMGDRYLQMLDACEESISRNVTENLFERHLKPLFL